MCRSYRARPWVVPTRVQSRGRRRRTRASRFPDHPRAGGDHVLGPGAHHDPVALADPGGIGAVLELRRFAVDELGLPDNSSYATYVDLDPDHAGLERNKAGRGRNIAVWTVVAADEFSIDPRTWCFPFAGTSLGNC